MYLSTLETPLGHLHIRAGDDGVFSVGFPETAESEQPNALSEGAKAQFVEYFALQRSVFDFSIKQQGTAFQQSVWRELQRIEAGTPISYAALSKRLQHPLAIRAIASANGKNNVMIAVPCHRVIGSNGELVGFSAGLWRKKWLLEHESKMVGRGQTQLW